MVKSGAAGIVSLSLSFLLGNHLSSTLIVFQAMFLGFISCGLSLSCFMVSLRQIGASQTSSLFGTAPFIGAVVSLMLFWQLPSVQMLCSLPFLIFGVVLLLKQRHTHVVVH
jgi:threonine/homoserine efflux transporter RhtA